MTTGQFLYLVLACFGFLTFGVALAVLRLAEQNRSKAGTMQSGAAGATRQR